VTLRTRRLPLRYYRCEAPCFEHKPCGHERTFSQVAWLPWHVRELAGRRGGAHALLNAACAELQGGVRVRSCDDVGRRPGARALANAADAMRQDGAHARSCAADAVRRGDARALGHAVDAVRRGDARALGPAADAGRQGDVRGHSYADDAKRQVDARALAHAPHAGRQGDVRGRLNADGDGMNCDYCRHWTLRDDGGGSMLKMPWGRTQAAARSKLPRRIPNTVTERLT